LAFASFGLAVVGGYSKDLIPQPVQIVLRLAFGIGAVALGYVALTGWAKEGMPVADSRGGSNGNIDELLKQQRITAFDAPWDYETSVRLAGRIADPRLNRTRVRERVTFTAQTLQRRVCIEHELAPGGGGEPFALLCLLRVPRGELVDDFRAWLPNGEDVRTLTHSEVGQLLTRMAYTLIRAAISPSRAPGQEGSEEAALVESAQRMLSGMNAGEAGEQLISKLEQAQSGDSQEARDCATLLLQLVSSLATTHPIVAVVPVPLGPLAPLPSLLPVSVFFAHGMPRGLGDYSSDGGRTASIRAWLRKHTWGRPTLFPIPIPKALSTDSYHLEVEAPSGSLIGKRWMTDQPAAPPGKGQPPPSTGSKPAAERVQLPARGAPSVWYADLDGPSFHPKVHLYTRNYIKRGSDDPRLVVQVVEALPGAMGRALTAALATTMSIWVVGAWGVKAIAPGAAVNVSATPAGSSVDLVAFLVAIPGVLAAWAAFGGSRENPFASLTTRFSLLASGVLGVVAAGVFLGQSNERISRWDLVGNLNLFLVSDVIWAGLFGLALLNLGWTGGTLAVRTIRHLGASQADASTRGSTS
jgi:hypothetical protein